MPNFEYYRAPTLTLHLFRDGCDGEAEAFGAWIPTYAWSGGKSDPKNVKRIRASIEKCEGLWHQRLGDRATYCPPRDSTAMPGWSR